MAVTKQTYAMSAGFDRTTVATALRSALINAGLMTEWYDSFSIGNRTFRVLQITHDSTKTYGTSFYLIVISNTVLGVSLIAGGWKASGTAPINIPTGTQYLDYYLLPTSIDPSNRYSQTVLLSWSTTSDFFLDCYTSQVDSKQSWFVLRQPATLNRSAPFSFLHKDTALHSWLDLNKGCVSGLSTIVCQTSIRAALVSFRIENNLQRCLAIGTALRGNVNTDNAYNNFAYNVYTYAGLGAQSTDSIRNNFPEGSFAGGNCSLTPLPLGKNVVNPAFGTDYVPICTNLPWNYWTPTRLADDFGIYMQYSANDIAYGTKFIVQSTINEWETLNFVNNAVLGDGASSTFLARVI